MGRCMDECIMWMKDRWIDTWMSARTLDISFTSLGLVSTKGLFIRLQNLEYILTEMYRNG